VFETCTQVNLQRGFGGGEVYTAAFTRALHASGVPTRLFIDALAKSWGVVSMPQARIEPLGRIEQLIERLRGEPPRWLAFHTFAPAPVIEALRAQGHWLTAFAHMPLYGRDPRPLQPFDLVFAVSRHVIASLHAAGIERVYPQPLYGSADLTRAGAGAAGLHARSRYDWDSRKLRDRLLGALQALSQPLRQAFVPSPPFKRRLGLTLGIVSRLTPIKQFPLQFSYLSPVLARHAAVNLEIFGSGGYASIRDLERALAPIHDRVRFWGHQSDVGKVYRSIDYLLTGLPEQEALGLNVIEAQACGTPVLAPDAPPFDETVLDGATGLRYRDPREDGGVDFERTLRRVLEGGFRFDTVAARGHLAQFSDTAFAQRVRALLAYLAAVAP